jgi:hypothetical protein
MRLYKKKKKFFLIILIYSNLTKKISRNKVEVIKIYILRNHKKKRKKRKLNKLKKRN